MPRKPIQPTPPVTDDADLRALEEAHRAADELHATERTIGLQSLELGRLLGQLDAAKMDLRYATLKRALIVQRIRDQADDWKGALFRTADGMLVRVNSFQQLCGLVGIEARAAYEWIQNVEKLGAEWVESFVELGLSRRQFRALRQLPEDALAAARKLAEQQKADELFDLLEEVTDRAQRESEALTKRAEKAEKAAGDKDRLIEAKNKKLDELDSKLHKKATAAWPEHARAVGEEGFNLAGDAMRAIAAFARHLELVHEERIAGQPDAQRAVALMLARSGALVIDETQDLIDLLRDTVEPLAQRFIPQTEEGLELLRTFESYLPEVPQE